MGGILRMGRMFLPILKIPAILVLSFIHGFRKPATPGMHSFILLLSLENPLQWI
jgi:hypothetical protein